MKEKTVPTRSREEIHKEIIEKLETISKTKDEINELLKEGILLSDDKQWFTEEEEEFVISKRPKKVEKHLTGRVNWKEEFKDESTGETVTINRSEIVRIDGEWLKEGVFIRFIRKGFRF